MARSGIARPLRAGSRTRRAHSSACCAATTSASNSSRSTDVFRHLRRRHPDAAVTRGNCFTNPRRSAERPARARDFHHGHDEDITVARVSVVHRFQTLGEHRCTRPNSPRSPPSPRRSRSLRGRRSRSRSRWPPPSRPRLRRWHPAPPRSTSTRSTSPRTSPSRARTPMPTRCRRFSSRWWCSTSPSMPRATSRASRSSAPMATRTPRRPRWKACVAPGSCLRRRRKCSPVRPRCASSSRGWCARTTSSRSAAPWRRSRPPRTSPLAARRKSRSSPLADRPARLPPRGLPDSRTARGASRAPLSFPAPLIIAAFVRAQDKERTGDRPLHLAHAERPQDPHHARGDRAAVHGAPDRHPGRGPVQARLPEDQSEQQDAGDRRPRRAGRQADGARRVRRDPLLPRVEDRQVPVGGHPRAVGGDAVGHVPDGPHRADARPGASLPRLFGREDSLRDGSLQERSQPALRRPRPPARRERVRRDRRLHDRRHGGHAVAALGRPAGREHGGVPGREALVRQDQRAAGREARAPGPRRPAAHRAAHAGAARGDVRVGAIREALRRRAMATLSGKVAWITGAGSGIGQAGALELAKAGATVVISGRRAEALEETRKLVTAAGGVVEKLPLDVADKQQVAHAAKELLDRHGRCDILVNSAGLTVPKRLYKDLVPEDWDKVIGINLNGALYCLTAVLPAMRAQHGGLVINISSWLGRWVGYLGGPAYGASKHAMATITHHLNLEEGMHGIRGCVIYPGEVATPILKTRPVAPSQEDIDRMLKPEDLGRTIRFVAEMPPHRCLNEIVITPTWNRLYLGGKELALGPKAS